MTEQKQLACNFCGKYREDVEKLISGPDVYICNECVTLSYKIIKKDAVLEVNDFNLEALPKPDEIKSFLDEYVIGQVFAKEILSVSAYNHYKRISQSAPNVEIEKTNILLVGSSGSGKTLLAKTLANKLKVPFAIADATTLTEAGYVGEDVESVLERLLSLANYDLSIAQKGIVFIDEVDKKARRSESSTSTRDVSGEGVQQGLLKIIEGSKVRINANTGGRKHPGQEMVEVDTSNVLFIVGGAFIGLEEIINERQNKGGVGFGVVIKDPDQEQSLYDIEPEDLIKYGFIPEFIGRFGMITHVKELTKEQLVSIMTLPKNAIVKQYKYLFKLDGVNLEFTKEAMEQIAEKSKEMKTNARGIKNIVEKILLNWQYNVQQEAQKGLTDITVNKESILDPASAITVYTGETNGKTKKV